MFESEVIDKLQQVRRQTFLTYDQITLDKSALKVFARLFVNPDCQTDIDIFAIEDKEVKLSYLGDHIITAGPSTVAQYATKKKLLRISEKELLRCFALDHAHDVHNNQVPEEKNVLYALSHILLIGRIILLRKINNHTVVDLIMTSSWGSIEFDNVVIPQDMKLKVGQYVYHHFGVVVAMVDDRRFAQEILKMQKSDDFINQLGREAAKKKIVIDFSDKKMFHKDVLGQILKPQKVSQVKDPGDLKGKKIQFKN